MPTAHRRIGVTKDPVLAAALDATRPLLSVDEALSEAGQVRRLALIGAEALQHAHVPAQGALDRQRLRQLPGVRPATRRIDDLPWLDAEGVDEARSASAALAWVRGDR